MAILYIQVDFGNFRDHTCPTDVTGLYYTKDFHTVSN